MSHKTKSLADQFLADLANDRGEVWYDERGRLNAEQLRQRFRDHAERPHAHFSPDAQPGLFGDAGTPSGNDDPADNASGISGVAAEIAKLQARCVECKNEPRQKVLSQDIARPVLQDVEDGYSHSAIVCRGERVRPFSRVWLAEVIANGQLREMAVNPPITPAQSLLTTRSFRRLQLARIVAGVQHLAQSGSLLRHDREITASLDGDPVRGDRLLAVMVSARLVAPGGGIPTHLSRQMLPFLQLVSNRQSHRLARGGGCRSRIAPAQIAGRDRRVFSVFIEPITRRASPPFCPSHSRAATRGFS